MDSTQQPLWQHQEEALAWSLKRIAALLHLGMGTGKTRIACEWIKAILQRYLATQSDRRFRVLVGCPKAVLAAWQKQCGMWLPEVRILVLDQKNSKKKDEAIAAALADTSPLIIVGNYESLRLLTQVKKVEWSAIVWDEIHRLKSPSGATSKWAAKLIKKNVESYRLGLSGTMIAHSPLDAFGVWRSVGLDTWGRSYTAFKATYSIPNPAIPGMVVAWQNQADMTRKIQATTFHRRTEDVIKWLPELTKERLDFTLSAEEARVYRELYREFAADVEGGTITPTNAMVGVLRLMQVCGGFCRLDDDNRPYRLVKRPAKQARLGELFQDVDPKEPLVVFCRFRDDIESVIAECKSHGRSHSELSGKINDLHKWQAGETNVLVAQIQSGGIGIDLTRASLGIFYSVGHSLSEYLQAVARLHRPGQTQSTRLYSLSARLPNDSPTVEVRAYQSLFDKKELIDGILDGIRSGAGSTAAAGVGGNS